MKGFLVMLALLWWRWMKCVFSWSSRPLSCRSLGYLLRIKDSVANSAVKWSRSSLPVAALTTSWITLSLMTNIQLKYYSLTRGQNLVFSVLMCGSFAHEYWFIFTVTCANGDTMSLNADKNRFFCLIHFSFIHLLCHNSDMAKKHTCKMCVCACGSACLIKKQISVLSKTLSLSLCVSVSLSLAWVCLSSLRREHSDRSVYFGDGWWINHISSRTSELYEWFTFSMK